MQLNLFSDVYALENEGFTVKRAFEPSGGRFKKLENTYSVMLNERVVLYVQDNENGTFNTFGFNHERFNVSLSEVAEIAKNKNNWCLIVNMKRSDNHD